MASKEAQSNDLLLTSELIWSNKEGLIVGGVVLMLWLIMDVLQL